MRKTKPVDIKTKIEHTIMSFILYWFGYTFYKKET